jgi:hypothetical protein
MKTLVIQSYRADNVPAWISRCLVSVKAWAQQYGFDHLMTDDRAFELCGADYLAAAGDNKITMSNLARLELIRMAHRDGYARAIWMDADMFVFEPDRLRIPTVDRITLARETWIRPEGSQWVYQANLNNSIIVCPPGDPDLDFIIQATRHTALHHPLQSNVQVGVELLRGLNRFLHFPLLDNVGILSNHVLLAMARGDEQVIGYQAVHHGTPIYAANLCASPHYRPPTPEADAMQVMDMLETTRGGVLNDRLPKPA